MIFLRVSIFSFNSNTLWVQVISLMLLVIIFLHLQWALVQMAPLPLIEQWRVRLWVQDPNYRSKKKRKRFTNRSLACVSFLLAQAWFTISKQYKIAMKATRVSKTSKNRVDLVSLLTNNTTIKTRDPSPKQGSNLHKHKIGNCDHQNLETQFSYSRTYQTCVNACM